MQLAGRSGGREEGGARKGKLHQAVHQCEGVTVFSAKQRACWEACSSLATRPGEGINSHPIASAVADKHTAPWGGAAGGPHHTITPCSPGPQHVLLSFTFSTGEQRAQEQQLGSNDGAKRALAQLRAC